MTNGIRRLTVQNTTMQIEFPHSTLNEIVVREILEGRAYPKPPLSSEIQIRSLADIGAHVGAAAVWFHHLWPEAAIHCFEPSSESIQFLRSNAPFAQVNPYALRRDAGHAKMGLPEQGSVLNSLKLNSPVSEEVECRSADELLDLMPDVIKLDTEGCEIEIIESARAAFQNARVIYVEYHRWQDRMAIERLIGATEDNLRKVLFAANVAWSVNRGELAYIDLAAIDDRAIVHVAL